MMRSFSGLRPLISMSIQMRFWLSCVIIWSGLNEFSMRHCVISTPVRHLGEPLNKSHTGAAKTHPERACSAVTEHSRYDIPDTRSLYADFHRRFPRRAVAHAHCTDVAFIPAYPPRSR